MLFPLKDDNPRQGFPALTLLFIVSTCGVFGYELTLRPDQLQALFNGAGAVPSRILAKASDQTPGMLPAPLTLLTSVFLHSGWMHLVSNMWFLWIFGDNVEDRLGRLPFIAFYLGCGVVAGAAHILLDPDSIYPLVGASGALSGVLGAYAVLFPRARVLNLIWIVVFIRTFYIPARLYLALWFGMQFLSLGEVGVAWWAHIGGFVAGALVALVLGRRGGPWQERPHQLPAA